MRAPRRTSRDDPLASELLAFEETVIAFFGFFVIDPASKMIYASHFEGR